MDILHPVKASNITLQVGHAKASHAIVHQAQQPAGIQAPMTYGLGGNLEEKGISATTVVIGLFIGLIALILVAVVLHAKLRNEEYTVRRKPIVMTEDDLDWDDSAITITVNPLDAQEHDETLHDASDFSDMEDEVAGETSKLKLKPVTRKKSQKTCMSNNMYEWDS